MHFEAIPEELRARPQWTVWRPELRHGKITKPPYRVDDPNLPARTDDRAGWGTFDQAVACYAAHASVLGGIGYMLSPDDPFVVFDVDDVGKAQPHAMPARLALLDALMALGTYAEKSPSGTGLHVWARARVGFKGRHMSGASGKLGIEVYAHQFITCTGWAVSPPGCGVVDAQAFIDQLGLGVMAPREELVDDGGKPLGLSDDEVLARAVAYVSWFAERWEARGGCEPGQWSHTFMAVLGVLDRITGSVAQVRRLVEGSPLVLAAAPAGTGESRLGKCRRTFADVMGRVRAGNRGSGGFTEHGRKVWEAICAKREADAVARTEAMRQAIAEASKLGGQAASLLNLFPDLTGGEHKQLVRPPGVAGDFVAACEMASHAPYTKFAIPATLSTLAGIVGRRYKTGSGSGTNVNFILAAPSSTGKTQSMHAWQRFINEAVAGMALSGAGTPRARILNNGTASIQGIMQDFEESPSCAWFIEECQSQLTGMSNPKTTVEAALRDAYNQLYDCAKHGQTFSAPRSVASRNANIQPVPNLAVSTYWTTTTSKFDVFTDDALDGFLSRVIIIRHTGPAGSLQRQVQGLAPGLMDRLRLLLTYADSMDKDYRDAATGGAAAMNGPQGPASKLVRVDDSFVQELDWRLVEQCEVVKNASLRGQLPPTYTAISRLPQTAMRLACVLAVVENPNAPSVTEAQLKWAFGYLLQNLVSLLSSMDSGEIGHVAGDEEAAVVRALKELMGRREFVGLPGVPRNVLFQHLKGAKVFCRPGQSRSKNITAALALMQSEGLTDEVSPNVTGQRGRPTKYVVPVPDHPIWKLVG